MSDLLATWAEKARTLPAAIGAELQSHGGILRCQKCQAEQPLGDTGHHTAHGWPKCCGETMLWITQRLLDEEAQR
jgi:hypothetical protein